MTNANRLGALRNSESMIQIRPLADPASPSSGRNLQIIRNAGTLVAKTGLTALLGFAFWVIAARLFTREAVGYASAVTSAITFLGELGMFGLGLLLIAELPKRAARSNLVVSAMLGASLTSFVTGLAFVLLAPHLNATLKNSSATLTGSSIVVTGVVLTAATFVFDQASIGVLRGELQLARNVAFSVGKLAILPAAALILHDQVGTGITLSWVAGIAISMVPVIVWLWWKGSRIVARPDLRVLRDMSRTIAAYNSFNVAATAPILLTPMLVAVMVSPAANGAFYAAWMITSMLYILPSHLSTVLVAVTASDRRALARRLRFTLMVSLLIGVPGVAALALGGHVVLSVFGKAYVSEATKPLVVLTLGYIPMVLFTHYTAVCRAIDRVSRAAAVSALEAISELAAVVIGVKWHGLVGLAVALVGVRCLAGVVVTPAVLGHAVGHGRHRYERRPVATGLPSVADVTGLAASGATAAADVGPRVTGQALRG